MSLQKVLIIILQVLLQLFYAYWNFMTLFRRDGYDIIEQEPDDELPTTNESQTEIEIT